MLLFPIPGRYAPVKVNPLPPHPATRERAGAWKRTRKNDPVIPPPGKFFIPMPLRVPTYQLKYILRFQFLFGENVSNWFCFQFVIVLYFTYNLKQREMCDSRKYPYPLPPTDGQWKFLGGGGAKG